MKKGRFQVLTDAREIELSPLIDMVFILLIFFIVTTVFVDESGFETAQSRPAMNPEEEKPPVVFVLRSNGSIEFDGRTISLSGVGTHIRSLVRRGEQPVIIQVQKGARSGLAVQVMDQARLAGAAIVNFSGMDG
tara:strand:+ start:137 stop:538 length:402 start_codon:yes stop_codon:yes gene_type:complete